MFLATGLWLLAAGKNSQFLFPITIDRSNSCQPPEASSIYYFFCFMFPDIDH
jgi:hypothetical protein